MKKIMWLNSKFHSTISRHHLEIVSRQKYRKNTDFGCFASFRSPLRPRDSSNSSFSPFPSLFCLSCPLLLSSHGPWPWLHVKPDTPHSLFSHHAVTSSAHHTALATASLYLSLSLCILSVLHVCRFGVCGRTQVGTESGPAEEKQEALWGNVEDEGGWSSGIAGKT